MQLVATLNGAFFRAQTCNEKDADKCKQTMLIDQEGLEFQVMTDEEFDLWLELQ